MSVKIRRLRQEPGKPMPGEGHHGVNTVMVVRIKEVSAYSCRILRISPGGSTAEHQHPREHVVMSLVGKARVETDNEVTVLSPGVILNIPSNMPHRFVNNTSEKTALLVQNIYL